MSIIDEALKVAARKAFVREEVSEEVFRTRYAICQRCEHFNEKDKSCGICGCYMEVKARARVHSTKKHPFGEVTHCPDGRWSEQDAELIEFYKKNQNNNG